MSINKALSPERMRTADGALREAAPPDLELSVVIPCLNEAETLATVIARAQGFLRQNHVVGEVVVADNGSTDGSPQIAEASGARVVHVPRPGYGSALMGGIASARGRYVVMGDADDSYDFSDLSGFMEKLRSGYDLVMGNRFKGGIKRRAMPFLHRYLGNPVLTWIGRLFFRSPVGDFHCGLRGFRKDSVERMQLQTTGMEFASEMVVKATMLGMRIAEVPTTLSPDGRSRLPHLRTWRDGWRHLRFMLLYSPRWLFLYPGIILVIGGVAVSLLLLRGPVTAFGATFDVQTLLYASMAILLGFQAAIFAIFTKTYAIHAGLLPEDARISRFLRLVSLETGLIVGALLILFGFAGSLFAVGIWGEESFGALDPSRTMRLIIPAVLSLTLGVQIILSSFFLSVLGLARRETR